MSPVNMFKLMTDFEEAILFINITIYSYTVQLQRISLLTDLIWNTLKVTLFQFKYCQTESTKF